MAFQPLSRTSENEKKATIWVNSAKGKPLIAGKVSTERLLAFSAAAREIISADDVVNFPQPQCHQRHAAAVIKYIGTTDPAASTPMKLAEMVDRIDLRSVTALDGTITCFKIEPRRLYAEVHDWLIDFISQAPLTCAQFRTIMDGCLDEELRDHVLKIVAGFLREDVEVPEIGKIKDFCRDRAESGNEDWWERMCLWGEAMDREEEAGKALEQMIAESDVARGLPNSQSDPLFAVSSLFGEEKEAGAVEQEMLRRPSLP